MKMLIKNSKKTQVLAEPQRRNVAVLTAKLTRQTMKKQLPKVV